MQLLAIQLWASYGSRFTLIIAAVSTISVMNVDKPLIWQSSSPTHPIIASTIDISARSQDTNQQVPLCPMNGCKCSCHPWWSGQYTAHTVTAAQRPILTHSTTKLCYSLTPEAQQGWISVQVKKTCKIWGSHSVLLRIQEFWDVTLCYWVFPGVLQERAATCQGDI